MRKKNNVIESVGAKNILPLREQMTAPNFPIRIAFVCPHIFMSDELMSDNIFSPGDLAIDLANGLAEAGAEVTLFSPGVVGRDNSKGKRFFDPTKKSKGKRYFAPTVKNITADQTLLKEELETRGYGLKELLKKHPLLFTTLSRHFQSEIIAKAYEMANDDMFDIVHVYMLEEQIALEMSGLCNKPVVFTHHDPYSFLTKYRTILPKYKDRNFISMSLSQREDMPDDTNWVGNVYHGIDEKRFKPKYLGPGYNPSPAGEPSPAPAGQNDTEYFAYLGRIIEPKGVHYAIAAVKKYNEELATRNSKPVTLKIAGKHYSDESNDSYWNSVIAPELNDTVEYVGYVSGDKAKQKFLGNAKALLVPSIFKEPFGMVTIEALSCGTPVIGLDNGATKELIENGKNGFVINDSDREKRKSYYESKMKKVRDFYYGESRVVDELVEVMEKINQVDRSVCRDSFENKFTLRKMLQGHIDIYNKLIIKV
ncbi:MAG: glycosyltransferase [Candidatus Dojkabacteria bacterium]|nr:glycosyltransferase [Candidatus Dojkabacteria bacterium]MDQ7020970.1 glycosyltransferase [Candidatus Dojkabacteria bacterium]